MLRLICFLMLGAVTQVQAAEGGSLTCKDASNGDQVVGAALREGIPQGHVLKVAIEHARNARNLPVRVDLDDGSTTVMSVTGTIDGTGYGECLLNLPDDLAPGVYGIRVRMGESGDDAKPGKNGRGLGGAIRVIAGEPNQHVPAGLPFLAMVLGAGLLLVLRERRPAV